MADPFSHRFRVRYSEVDPQAVVFNSRYLEYADVVVSEFFRARRAEGMPDIEFHIRKAEVDYLRPIRLEELVEGRLRVERIGNSSVTFAIALFGEKYQENVKVYSIGDFSKEVCGGPHAKRTSELGRFRIIKEQSSSSGVRRIRAVLEASS